MNKLFKESMMNHNKTESTDKIIVIKIIDEYQIVINKGSNDKIMEGNKFIIYRLSEEELKDPITKENLGYLEHVKGRVIATHVQEKISTLKSHEKINTGEKRIIKRPTGFSITRNPFHSTEEVEIIEDNSPLKKLHGVQIGDLVKEI